MGYVYIYVESMKLIATQKKATSLEPFQLYHGYQEISTLDFLTPSFNPGLFKTRLFNPLFQKFMIEKFMIEKFMIEKLKSSSQYDEPDLKKSQNLFTLLWKSAFTKV